MFLFSFQTIKSAVEGFYKEKGSKFMAFAFPVETEEDVKEKIINLKKKYFMSRLKLLQALGNKIVWNS